MTPTMIVLAGAKPVFVDIDPKTYNMCPTHTREVAKQCRKLKAIVPVPPLGAIFSGAAVTTPKSLASPPVKVSAEMVRSARPPLVTVMSCSGPVEFTVQEQHRRSLALPLRPDGAAAAVGAAGMDR